MPSRLSTFRRVVSNIRTSVANERWSTYHTSSSNFSCHEIAFRPWHCAQPVMPGSTSWRRACRAEYRGKYSTNSGRGPMIDISPRNTLNNWGSSSNEVARKKRPIRVERLSSDNNAPLSSRSSVIVRNLTIRNTRPSLPGRSCRKKTLPFRVRNNPNATTSRSGAQHISPKPAPTTSKSRLKNLRYICLLSESPI